MLAGIIISTYVEIDFMARYDALFLWALLIQAVLIITKMENPDETKVICLFHLVGTVMELYKTSEGVSAWTYPEESFFRIGNVPLFSGFMYASVGSYLCRVWDGFQFRFKHYPDWRWTVLLSVLIYVNFFTNQFWYDFRLFLFIGVALLWGRTIIYFKSHEVHRFMSLLLGFLLVSLFIWFAENVGTFTQVWLYPDQIEGWQMVSWQKLGSWFLLMIISFVMVERVKRGKVNNNAPRDRK